MKSRKKGIFKAIFNWLLAIAVIAGVLYIAAPSPPKHKAQKTSVHVAVIKPPEYYPPPMSSGVGGEESVPAPDVTHLPPVPAPVPPIAGKKPKIAIVIDDVGLDVRGSKRATGLPAAITLSYIPYAHRLDEQTHEAREKGHELLLHMPMEPMGHDNPGQGALLVNLSMDELQKRFVTALSSFVGFDGVNNHMGSKFTAYQAGMEMVVEELKARNLFFLDSRTSPKTVGEATARREGVPTIPRDVFLDDDMSSNAVKAQLERTEQVARHKGYAVAIGHPHATTLDALEEWIPLAEQRGFEFVPLRQLVIH